jgi:hypothetical protein
MLPADGRNVKLGKGSLLLAVYDGANAGAFKFRGNVTALQLSAEVTKAELFSSTQASSPKIAESVTRIGYTLTGTFSEYTKENLKDFLLGENASRAQAVGTNVQKNFTGAEVEAGGYVYVTDKNITNVSVTRDGTDVLTADTDYIVYADRGLVQLLSTGSVQDGDDIQVEYDRPALTIDTIRIAKEGAPVCHLLYFSDDANTDGRAAKDVLEIWRVAMAPEGELNFISDEYGNFQLTMGVLSDPTNHPTDPFGTLERIRE